MMILALILLGIALVAIIALRKLGHLTPSSGQQISETNGSADMMPYLIMADTHAPDDAGHFQGDGHDHSADFSDSSSADGGADSGTD